MIDSLKGTVLEKTPEHVVVECAGLGYLAMTSATATGALPAVGEECRIYTEMRVTENDVSLYGFSSRRERESFRLLTGVSGPKVGLAILGVLSPDRIALAIAGEDHKAFTAAPGVGPKLAQRIVLELKDKMKGFGAPTGGAAASVVPTDSTAQAMAALTSLGYTGTEAAQALTGIDPALPVQEIIRLALQSIGKRR